MVGGDYNENVAELESREVWNEMRFKQDEEDRLWKGKWEQ
jgi:hypothetical protein